MTMRPKNIPDHWVYHRWIKEYGPPAIDDGRYVAPVKDRPPLTEKGKIRAARNLEKFRLQREEEIKKMRAELKRIDDLLP